ncbi:MAG: putative zinc-binding metallopeptidase [Rhodospirillales bacterium]|nr:putative zinc-binding metallopeptidase [Rhodospirillales bacterium]
MAESPITGRDRGSPGAAGNRRGPRRGRSVIPEVPLRSEADADPAQSSLPGALLRAVVVYGGLALVFCVTLLVENHLDERERTGLEQQALEVATFSGELLDQPAARLERVKAETARIREDFGVEVHFLYEPKQYFPRGWRAAPISATGAQLPLDEVERVLPAIRASLERYPRQLIRDNLSDIYLVSGLTLFGELYGGTYDGSAIYMNSEGAAAGYTESEVRATLHHEFSSILMYGYGFDFAAWRAINERGFVYPDNALEIIGRAESYEFNDALLAQGFLSGYARSNIENDINVMAEWLFTQRAYLQVLAGRYDRIDRKMHIALQFYKAIDPTIEFD